MNIGFISEHYPPTDGGVATSTQRIARQFVKSGNNVFVIVFDHSKPITSDDYFIIEEDQGVKVIRIGPFFLKRKDITSISEKVKAILRRRAFNQICNFLKKNPVDIILSFYLLNAGFVAQFVARELKIPVIAGVRGNDIGRNIFSVDRFAVTQWVINGSSKIICVNQHLKHRLIITFPEADSKTSVIRNSVFINKSENSIDSCRQKISSATGWNDKDLRITFIGTIREKKGALTLVESLADIRSKINAKLLIIGPAPGNLEMRQFGDLWNQLKSEGIIYETGLIPRELVSEWAMGCDILVMPSIDDGLPNGLLEGMALGLCPVASDIFQDVIIHKQNGLIFEKGNHNELSNLLILLDSSKDMISELGKAAKKTVLEWTPEHEANSYIDIFKSLI